MGQPPILSADPAVADPTAESGALEQLPIAAAVVACDRVPRLVAANAAFRRAGLGGDTSPLIAGVGARIAAFLQRGGPTETFGWEVGSSVDCRHYHLSLARIAGPGARCLVMLVDHTSELRTRESLRREMCTDSLTGLPNRAGFGDQLEAAMAGEDGAPTGAPAGERVAVLMVDLDRFSRLNACLGGLTGDELLISVARRLKGALRARDVLARTGGDEFGILLHLDGGRGDAEHVAKRIRGALAEPFRLSDYEIKVTCSMGIAFGGDALDERGAADGEALIRHAQFAVGRAKATGWIESYQTQAFDTLRERFGMETALRRALDEGRLRLTYQPICDLATGRPWAFEALARWTAEDGTELSPVDFIPVAEESGLIVPLGRWAIDEALRTLAAWDARAGGACGTCLSVNLSAIQFGRDTVAPMVADALTRHGIAGERLKLELTESALVADPDRIAGTLDALRALGTTLAMDDFGTGYSNLALLQKLPIDVLKIDRSFVTGMLADRDKVAIVRAVLGLAQALGMRTVAEGIETPELARTLGAMGCGYGQGYAFARALEADEAYRWLAERNA